MSGLMHRHHFYEMTSQKTQNISNNFNQQKYKKHRTYPFSFSKKRKNITCSIRIKYEDNYMYDSASGNCSFHITIIWNRQPTICILHNVRLLDSASIYQCKDNTKTLKMSLKSFSVFIVYFEDFSNVFLVFLLGPLNGYLPRMCYNDSNCSGASTRHCFSSLPNALNNTSNQGILRKQA